MATPLPTVRIVLFGRAGSGKSALLAALADVVRERAGELKGDLVADEGAIEQLGKTEGAPIVPYRLRYRLAEGGELGVVLLDCQGQAASELLGRLDELGEQEPQLPLAREVLAADALLLAVDASASPEQLQADFTAFKAFLSTVEGRRGEQAEIGGLPVYLVLTHADLLARPLDTPGEWLEDLEARKREVDEAFAAHLGGPAIPEANLEAEEVEPEEDEGRESGFGWVDVHVWATALKRPPLRGAAATEKGPYGVAELFRQCLAGAADYRRREQRSRGRLLLVVAAALHVIALLLGLTAAQALVDRHGRTGDLASRIDDLRFLGTTPEQYLSGSLDELRGRQTVLTQIQADPRFAALPENLQTFVNERLAELTDYIDYYQKLQRASAPYDEWTTEGLQRLSGRLASGDLALPRTTWAKTPAGQLHHDRARDTESLLKAARGLVKWYESAGAEAGQLWTFSNHPPRPGAGVPWNDWADRALDLLAPTRQAPPVVATDPLPDADGLTYADALRLFEVQDARIGWELERERLAGLLNVVAALGLARDVRDRPAVLAVPRDFRLTDAAERLAQLKKSYPNATRAFGTRQPEAVEAALAQAARESYRALLAPARAEVLRQYRASKAPTTDGKWDDVRAWLRSTDELKAWNELALVLLRLFEAQPEAPVPALTRFLGEKKWPLTLHGLTLQARRFSGIEPREGAEIKLTLTRDGKETVVNFPAQGKGRPDLTRNVVEHTYRLKEQQSLTYQIGDELALALPLQTPAGEKQQRLVWIDHRSPRYQFERLRNPPRRANGTAGRPLDEVRLLLQPDSGVPRVPDLLPEMGK